MKDKQIKLALVQMSNAGSFEKNLNKSLDAVCEAAGQQADIVLFPEVHLTEFFPQYEGKNVSEYGISLDSEIIKQFQKACKDNAISTVPNIYLKENHKYYDASIFIDKHGDIIGIQKMVHVAQAKQFYEQDYYTPSDNGFQTFQNSVAIAMCNRVGALDNIKFYSYNYQ